MKVEWVNHASFVLAEGKTRLLCDPWLEGLVFDESWALLSPTVFSYDDFRRITHIWFSHEHPDHFFPPNLKRIPADMRRNITVLFQPTGDKRIVSFCRGLDFRNVVELPSEWYPLSDELKVLCQPITRGDSWIAVKSSGLCVLDVNDCVLTTSELDSVARRLGKVDVLVTQFSYASWWGNCENTSAWTGAADDCLVKIGSEIGAIKPRFVVPAASFVYFCHAENRYMNQHINRVDRAHDTISRAGAQSIVLYPGAEWTIGEPWDSTDSLRRYAADYDRALADPVRTVPKPIDYDELSREAQSFVQALRKHNSGLLLRRIPPALIDISDHQMSVELGTGGLRQVSRARHETHDISLASGALSYCLRFQWGGETLFINGRFREPHPEGRKKFFRWTSVAQANSRNQFYDLRYYGKRLGKKVAELAGIRNDDRQ